MKRNERASRVLGRQSVLLGNSRVLIQRVAHTRELSIFGIVPGPETACSDPWLRSAYMGLSESIGSVDVRRS